VFVERQRQDGAVQHRVHFRIGSAQAPHLVLRVDAVQAAAIGAEPDLLAAPGDGEDLVAFHLREQRLAEMAETLAAGIHHAHAAAFARHPDAVAAVHVQRLQHVARQRGRIVRIVAPDAEAGAVVARQAVPGGCPQETVVVARQRRHGGGRQAVGGTEHAEARDFGHGGAGGRGDHQQHAQPKRTQHRCLLLPVPNRRNASLQAQAAAKADRP
jgi:hypothetical protein